MKTNLAGKPTANGTKIGQTVKGVANIAMGSKTDVFWKWNGKEWVSISKKDYTGSQVNGSLSYKDISTPITTSINSAIRYPSNVADAAGSDYVLFQFYEYQPPFQNRGNDAVDRSNNTAQALYNESATSASLYKQTTEKSIAMYMPEDISTGYKANWSGKAFSNIGRDLLKSAGAESLTQGIANAGTAVSTALNQIIPNLGEAAISQTISKITGENIDNNDIFGSTRGVILNPNVELLFSGIDLRNISFNYKLVPRNQPEADNIKNIYQIFKRAMLPKYSDGSELNFSSGDAQRNNFIKVPNVCKISFMRGGALNKDVAQYKMCAITGVDINFTPDGTYATYESGSMVAVTLSLSFQETKLIFSEEAKDY